MPYKSFKDMVIISFCKPKKHVSKFLMINVENPISMIGFSIKIHGIYDMKGVNCFESIEGRTGN